MDWKFELAKEEFEQCRRFALESAKSQREYRSGGTAIRNIRQIEEDTMRGKTAEVIAKKFLGQSLLNIQGIKLDFNIYPRGKWDEQDITLNGRKISIKSAKWFSKWLLLESKDIARGDIYDYYIFITISENFKSGDVCGFATKDEILNDKDTIHVKKGNKIPGTSTFLDADNYARHRDSLHNSEKEWIELCKKFI